MKIRSGFVSNSSSSSFIITFPEKIESPEQLKKYGNDDATSSTSFTPDEAYKYIFKYMEPSMTSADVDIDNIAKYLMNMSYEWTPEVSMLSSLSIYNVESFYEFFNVHEHDIIHKSVFDNIKSIIDQEKESKNYRYFITACDNDGLPHEEMRWNILPNIFPGRTEKFSN